MSDQQVLQDREGVRPGSLGADGPDDRPRGAGHSTGHSTGHRVTDRPARPERRPLSARERRHRRQTATLAVIAASVLVAGLAAGTYWQGWWSLPPLPVSVASDEQTPCPTPEATAAVAADVAVSVLNSTDRRGLAAEVARELQARQMTVPAVGNDADERQVPEAAQVRHGPGGLLAARAVAAQVVGAVLVDDGRDGSAVDLALGDAYSGLRSAAEAETLTAPVFPEGTPERCLPGARA